MIDDEDAEMAPMEVALRHIIHAAMGTQEDLDPSIEALIQEFLQDVEDGSI
jgi:hypothetical protein